MNQTTSTKLLYDGPRMSGPEHKWFKDSRQCKQCTHYEQKINRLEEQLAHQKTLNDNLTVLLNSTLESNNFFITSANGKSTTKRCHQKNAAKLTLDTGLDNLNLKLSRLKKEYSDEH